MGRRVGLRLGIGTISTFNPIHNVCMTNSGGRLEHVKPRQRPATGFCFRNTKSARFYGREWPSVEETKKGPLRVGVTPFGRPEIPSRTAVSFFKEE